MLTMGQKLVAVASLGFIFAVSFYVSPLFSMLLVPVSIVAGIMVWKL